MVALLFAAFLIYLYAPHLVFKFAASGKFDFVVRKDLPQVEEFFAAALPSAILNGLAWLWFRFGPVHRVYVDQPTVASVFRKEPDLSTYFGSHDASALLTYLLWLYVIAWVAGRFYGGALRTIALAGGTDEYLSGSTGIVSAIARAAIVYYRKLWRPYYSQFEQPLYPQVLQESYAFIHTLEGLYHGILYQYDKKRDGDLEGIYLVSVSKFSRKSEKECFEQGINPISDLDGPLFIKWSEIRDINYPQRGRAVLEEKRRFYDTKVDEYRRRANPSLWDAIKGLLRKFRKLLAS